MRWVKLKLLKNSAESCNWEKTNQTTQLGRANQLSRIMQLGRANQFSRIMQLGRANQFSRIMQLGRGQSEPT